MTSAPTTRMLNQETTMLKGKRPQQIRESNNRQDNVSIIFSESTGHRLDTLSFKMSSKLSTYVQDIETALLVLYLHPWNDTWDKPQSGLNRRSNESINISKEASPKQQKHHKHDMNASSDDESDKYTTNIRPDSDNLQQNNSGSSYQTKSQRKYRSKEGEKKRMRELNSSRVKIILKVVEQVMGTKRKIAEQQIIVKGLTTMAIPIPKDLLITTAASANHTLVLQISCKRCKGRVHIVKVYKTFKQKNQKSKTRLNSNRPYLFIKTGNITLRSGIARSATEKKLEMSSEIARRRLKRQTSTNYSDSFEPTQNQVIMKALSIPVTCSSRKSFISFGELGLDFIIYPKGLSTVSCRDSCGSFKLSSSSLRPMENVKPKVTNPFLNKLEGAAHSESHLIRSVDLRKYFIPMSSTRIETPNSNCRPAVMSSLAIVYLDDLNKATFVEIDNLVYESCECSSDLHTHV